MTRRTRNILFLFLIILFLIVTPITVLYSLGWRFDWETKKVFQPGIFYFKVLPKSVEVNLDGKFKKKTDFFFGSVLIENLFPKKYEVEIKREGFQSWKKTLEIKEREVTEAKNIVLIPESPEFKILFKEVEDFFFSADEKKIIIKEKTKEGWALKLFEIDKNVKSHLISEKDILARRSPGQPAGGPKSEGGPEEAQLIDLKFSPDSKIILLEIGVEEKLNYYLLEIAKTPAVLVPLDFLNKNIEEIYFNPKNPQKLLVKAKGILTEADLIEKKIALPVLEKIATISILNDTIYYLDNSGFLFKTDFSLGKGNRLNIIPFPLKNETEYKIFSSGFYILLKENDILYIFDENKKSFQKIFEQVKDLEFSLDSKKLVYFNNYEIWVLFLEKNREMPQKEAGERLFLTRFSEKIDNVFWYTNHYLIFNVGNKIKIAELDDRDRINIVDLAEFKNPEIFWANKKLYILSEENLYASEKLIP